MHKKTEGAKDLLTFVDKYDIKKILTVTYFFATSWEKTTSFGMRALVQHTEMQFDNFLNKIKQL